MATEEEFEAHVVGNLTTAEKALGYEFAALRQMLDELGAIGTACHLLDLSRVGQEQKGFTLLAEADLLHLSLEQAVIDFRESGLFPPSLVASARARLLVIKNRIKRKSK